MHSGQGETPDCLPPAPGPETRCPEPLGRGEAAARDLPGPAGSGRWTWVLRRRQMAVLGLAVTTTLLVCDAWFDVCLSWRTGEQAWALASAAPVELPAAAVTAVGALRILDRTGAVVRQLRGQVDRPRSVWTDELVMTQPHQAG